MRIGYGIDIHPYKKGRSLILGGVRVPYKKGLQGHSDADVLVHAIMDALLGAAGLGDIGKHFPNTDKQYRNISSLVLLSRVNSLLKNKKYTVQNIDATLVIEEPKIGSYIEKMEQNISKVLKIPKGQINIKATRSELLGFVGRSEGVVAQAVCLLRKQIHISTLN